MSVVGRVSKEKQHVLTEQGSHARRVPFRGAMFISGAKVLA